jgi:hypothetical protein
MKDDNENISKPEMESNRVGKWGGDRVFDTAQ